MTDGRTRSGRSNEWDPEAYAKGHSFVYEAADDPVELLDPGPDERILDLGSGTGPLSNAIAECAECVVGVDRSRDMVTRAAHNHPGLSFVGGDATSLPFERAFDAVFSNAVLHWIDGDDQGDALAEIYGALRPSGRLVAELGGPENISRILAAVRRSVSDHGIDVESPWYFPTPGEYARRLERHGFDVRELRVFDRPTRLEDGERGLRNWLELFGDGFFEDLTPRSGTP